MKNFLENLSAFVIKARNPEAWKFYAHLNERQWWDEDRITQYAQNKTKLLLIHAKKTVPYYRDLFFKNNIDPETMDLAEYWNKIPILTKSIVKKNALNLKSDSSLSINAVKNSSGGSTGKPIDFLSDIRLYQDMNAFMYLIFSWAGWKPGETVLHLWGGNKVKDTKLKIATYLKTKISGQIILPVYSYNDQVFEEWWRCLKSYKPTIVYAYPSVAAEFSDWLLKKGYQPKGIKGIFSSAETLFPEHRLKIETVFGCKVYNQYGSREAPNIACECEYGNMHMFSDLNILDFLQTDSGNTNMEVVVTSLNNYVQPFIRYNLNDVSCPIKGKCKCGRGYPLMQIDIGRQNDHLINSCGDKIYPSFFVHLLDGINWINNYQFRQHDLNKIVLTIEPEDTIGINEHIESLKERLLQQLKSKMGENISLQIITGGIQRTVSGKFRFVLNDFISKKG